MSVTYYQTRDPVTQQPQTVIVQNPEMEYQLFASRMAVNTAGIQLVLGILAVIFQISATAIEAGYGSAFAGAWAGFSVNSIYIIQTYCKYTKFLRGTKKFLM